MVSVAAVLSAASTAAQKAAVPPPPPPPAAAQSWLQRMWNHPAGPKTVFFWSPIAKWCLVVAGLGDMKRPVETLSAAQNGALAATGLIWSRYALVITPVNYSLMAVNVFVFGTGIYQLGRIFNYRYYGIGDSPVTQTSKPTKSIVASSEPSTPPTKRS